jgi:Alkylated DNA repair protein
VSLLFDEPLIEGFKYEESLIGPAEEEQLIDRLTALEMTPFQFHGFTGNRKTMSFGWRYDFNEASFTRTEAIPDWLQPLRRNAAAFANLEAEDFVHALVARYDANAGIGWHRDRDVFEQVVGASLGTPAILRFRQRIPTGFRRASQRIEPCSVYLLSGPARWQWEHSITAGDQLRFSITFRTLSDKGRRIAARG